MKLTKAEAKAIAEKITPKQIIELIYRAAQQCSNWEAPARLNGGMNRGAAFNVLAAGYDPAKDKGASYLLRRRNLLMEFGEFLPDELLPVRASRRGKEEIKMKQPPQIHKAARLYLGLLYGRLPEESQQLFARIYPAGVEGMDASKLRHAIRQCERTLEKLGITEEFPTFTAK